MSESIVDISFFDTTLRDGAQSLSITNQFQPGAKVKAANSIAELGIGVIEAGFPATRGDDLEVREVAETIGNQTYSVSNWSSEERIGSYDQIPIIAALSRAVPKEIEEAWHAVSSAMLPRIHTFIATDAEHMQTKFPGLSPDQILDKGVDAIRRARELTAHRPHAEVEFSAEAATTTNHAFLERVVKEAINNGADIINVPDTVGQKSPFTMFFFYRKVIGWALSANKNVTISAHNHNDLGLAVANSMALVWAAAEYSDVHSAPVKVQLETTFCGLGERAGNADIFPIAAGLFKFVPDLSHAELRWNFNRHRSYRAAREVLKLANLEVPPQSPVVGSAINRHYNGIHSSAILKGDHRLYTSFNPTEWGHPKDAVLGDGKYQGQAGREFIKGQTTA
jgi:2-isopropylmalate synthase